MIRLLTAIIEISIISVLVYYILVFIRATGAVPALKGIGLLAIAIALARLFHLDVLFSLFSRSFPYLFLAFIIIFAAELRRALAELGRRRIFNPRPLETMVISEIVEAVTELSRKKIGGLIAIQRDIGLGIWAQSGVAMNSEVSSKILVSIFMPSGPLHDGGVIIENDRIKAAACLFPFSNKRHLAGGLGMRHKAALGMAEASDSLVIVISEETGTISVAFRARLVRNVEEDGLRKLMEENLNFKKK